MNTELYEHLKTFSTNPYLFVGSGLSRRYINLPNWEELLNTFFSNSKIEGDFGYYQSMANGNLPLIASKLAGEFHKVWWKNPVYKDKKVLNLKAASESSDFPFKLEISDLIKSIQKSNSSYNKEIKLFKTSVIDGLITTNWDTFLEDTFEEYKVYIGQQELLFSESISIGEIYKIHGCITRPETIIVTEEDYEDYNAKNAYLAAKLLTIFVEHPIIFIGYSLSDTNIQQIIDSIVKCVDSKNLSKIKDRLIFVEWEHGKEFEMKDTSIKLLDNKVLPIKLIKTDSFEPIFETLSTLKRQIPVQILRKLKSSVVEFVKSSNPTNKIFVKDIDSISEDTKFEYAIGVGVATQLMAKQGYKPLETIDIIEDILYDNKNFDSMELIENTFPKMSKLNGFFPCFKYFRSGNLLNKNGSLNPAGIAKLKGKVFMKKNIPTCFLPAGSYIKKQTEIRRNHKDVSSIDKAFDKVHSLNFIPLLELKNIDISQLLKFLIACFNDSTLNNSTPFRKLVCLYDYLKYGIT